MLLVIPALDIKGGRCVQVIQGLVGFSYSNDPVTMAKLWRTENAKALHVTDLDGVQEGRLVNISTIQAIVAAVDIPIVLRGGLRSFDAVRKAFDLGAYRAVVGTTLLDHPAEAHQVLETYGPSKIVLGLDGLDGLVSTHGIMESTGKKVTDVAMKAKEMGFRRLVYTDVRLDGTMRGVDPAVLRELGEKTGMRITVSGGIAGLEDLLKVQELEKYGVDSVVIGRALCENKFSCQGLWRQSEAGNYPYTAKV
jgi:phosphoribosylformimino-5-aminoimidazole carboxamide ribotide isomerase